MLQRLQQQIEQFDFTIFQRLNTEQQNQNSTDMSPFNIFQRFCVLLLVLNGGVEKSQEETKLFLKSLHVYKEVKEIDARVRVNAAKCDLQKLKELTRAGDADKLQTFINTTVEYA